MGWDSMGSSERPMVHKADCWRRNGGGRLLSFAQGLRKGKTLETTFFFFVWISEGLEGAFATASV